MCRWFSSFFETALVNRVNRPSHSHSHAQVVAFNVTRADVSTDGRTRYGLFLGSHAFGRGVRSLMTLATRGAAVQLDQLSIIHVTAKRALYSFQIAFVAVRSVRGPQPCSQVVHEFDCSLLVRSPISQAIMSLLSASRAV